MNKRINFILLDGLRGLAAFYVMFGHCRAKLLIGGNAYAETVPIDQWSLADKIYYGSMQLTSLSREFVILFFVLSGFSIAYSLKQQTNFLDFYKKRLVRLYPPYLLALFWAFIVFYFYNDYWPYTTNEHSVFGTWTRVFKNLFYIADGELIAQFWSLTHEVIFYILAPFILIKLGIRKSYLIISVLLYLPSLIYYPLQDTTASISLGFLFDYNIYFAIGVWTFYNLEKIEKFAFFNKKRNAYLLLIVIPIMIVVNYKLGVCTKISLLLAAFVSVPLIVFTLKYEMKSRILSWIGKFSYTLYITHIASLFLFIILLRHYLPNLTMPFDTWYLWLICVVFCLLMAWGLYLIAEYPSKRYLEYLRTKKNKRKEDKQQ